MHDRQRPAARRSVVQRGDDLCHSSHSFPPPTIHGGKATEDYYTRSGREGMKALGEREENETGAPRPEEEEEQ